MGGDGPGGLQVGGVEVPGLQGVQVERVIEAESQGPLSTAMPMTAGSDSREDVLDATCRTASASAAPDRSEVEPLELVIFEQYPRCAGSIGHDFRDRDRAADGGIRRRP